MIGDLLPESLPEPEAEERPSRRPLAVLAVAVLALAGAGVFALSYLGGGSNTPEDAVRSMASAISDEDLLGVIDALAPSERDVLRGSVEDVSTELRRLKVLDDDVDLSGIDGVDLEVTDLRLAARPLGEGVSLVSVNGKVSASVDVAQLPTGSFVEDKLPGGAGDVGNAAAVPTVEDQPIDDLELVTVQEGGRWYVSLFYSVADAARRDAGKPVPDFGNGVRPDGASSPEAAVRELIEAGVALDARRAIALLPPDEGRVVQDYAPLFLPDVERAVQEARGSFSLEIDDLELTSDRDGDEATVAVARIRGTVRSDGETATFSFDGRCIVVTVDGETESSCDQPAGDDASRLGSLTGIFGGIGLGDAGRADGGLRPGLVTVQRDGEWFVSPIRSVLHPVVAALRAVEADDLENLGDLFGGLATGVVASVGSTVELAAGSPVPLPVGADRSDRSTQSNLRNALVAFKVGLVDAGEWPTDPAALSEIEPSVVFVPAFGVIPPQVVVFEVVGDTARLASRGSSGCFYLVASSTGDVGYAADAGCGPMAEQDYSPEGWS
jgi:hypothetical protein